MSKPSIPTTATTAAIGAPVTTEPTARRGFVAASAALGSLAAVATLWAGRKPEATVAQAPTVKPDTDMQGGYQLSEHVKRYYQTTLL
jgi:hypothetical protein